MKQTAVEFISKGLFDILQEAENNNVLEVGTQNFKRYIEMFEKEAKKIEEEQKGYSEEEVKHLMTLAFEQGFKKADIVEAGLEAKETDIEVNWIFLKHKK